MAFFISISESFLAGQGGLSDCRYLWRLGISLLLECVFSWLVLWGGVGHHV